MCVFLIDGEYFCIASYFEAVVIAFVAVLVFDGF